MARSLLGWDVASVAGPQNWRHCECSVLQRADKECEIDVRSTQLANQTRDEGVLRREWHRLIQHLAARAAQGFCPAHRNVRVSQHILRLLMCQRTQCNADAD